MDEKISWDTYFLNLAFVVSQKSKDIHTKHGCIIVDHNNHIIGTGYNSFPRQLRDELMPIDRPDKYHWMIHSEVNAVSNCSANLWLYESNQLKAYITGQPCLNCLMHLWQNNIKNIIIADRRGSLLEDCEYKERMNFFLEESFIKISRIPMKTILRSMEIIYKGIQK